MSSPSLRSHASRPPPTVAAEAVAVGYGGIAAVWRATGIAPITNGRCRKDLAETTPLAPGHIRGKGGGRKSLVEKDPALVRDLLALVEIASRGDPMSPLRWRTRSL